MSGVMTSSLSLPSSLRNWVILDYEEANGLTIRPWAPVRSPVVPWVQSFASLCFSLSLSHVTPFINKWTEGTQIKGGNESEERTGMSGLSFYEIFYLSGTMILSLFRGYICSFLSFTSLISLSLSFSSLSFSPFFSFITTFF